MISETVKLERKEIGVKEVKQMLDDGAKLTAEQFETGIIDNNNYPVKEYRAVITKKEENGEKTKVIMNMLEFLKLLELYIEA